MRLEPTTPDFAVNSLGFSELEPFDGFLEVVRHSRLELQAFIRSWMVEGDFPRVQHLTRKIPGQLRRIKFVP